MLDSHSPSASSQLLGVNKEADSVRESYLEGQETFPGAPKSKASSSRYSRRKIIAAVVIIVVIVIFLAVFLPVLFVVIRKRNGSHSGSGGSGVPNPSSPSGAIVSFQSNS